MLIRNLLLQIIQINNGDNMKYLKTYNLLNEEFDNIHEKYPYNCIVIVLNNSGELLQFLSIMEKNNIKGKEDLIYNITKKLENGIRCYARIHINGHRQLWVGGNSLDMLEEYSRRSRFTYNKIYSIREINFILPNIIKHGVVSPSYKPNNKSSRTLD